MIAIERPVPSALAAIEPQPAQAFARIDLLRAGQVIMAGPCWVLTERSRPVAAGGFYPDGANAWCWALIGRPSRAAMLALHRQVRRAFVASGFTSIRTVVDPGFAAGVRWVGMLGFFRTGPGPDVDGRTFDLWTWMRDHG